MEVRPLEGVRVLLAEDSPDIREVFAMLLRAEGAQVVATDNGREAISLIGTGAFDVLLTDLGLPDVAGEHVVRRAAAAQPRPRIVVVTGYGEPFLGRARQAGADVVLVKPIPWASLVVLLTPRPTRSRPSVGTRSLAA